MAETQLRSALIVAVPEAAAVVDTWRERTSYAKPSSGIPPHVTILVPFVPPATIDDSLIEDLRTLFGTFESFTFELGATGRFPTVLYLAPDPAEPFVQLTRAVCEAYPAYPPYGGTFDSIVPHLTTAEGTGAILSAAEADVLPSLPITAEASEALLIEEVEPDSARWRTRAPLPFGQRV
jgi:2'-5' RNA ligase